MDGPAQESCRVERTYTFDPRGVGAAWHRELDGLAILERILDGRLPMSPIAGTLDFRLVEAEKGRVVFEAMPAAFGYNLAGTMHGGYAATLLDSAMGCAVCSMVPKGRAYTTTDLSIRYIRPMTEASGLLRAEGRIINAGRRVATAEGRLYRAEDGKLCAHGTTSCLVFEA
ncbi:PaaI family thioesterase [Marinimicrococcus flavescens]|uniref:PaaI family thioesterase n=1 Tax=Marinimicrococcus flavescens TaxID=3031815 RepID=A0AAP3XRT4_9PROT|nr:PaaI family thioesterase [Marinimicrococcus flavescens]